MRPNKVTIIAELGINHQGNGYAAYRTITALKNIKPNIVKFQSYRPAEILGVDNPNYEEAERAQFGYIALAKLRALTMSNHMEFGLSIFHPDQIEICETEFRLERYKIASRAALNRELVAEIAKTNKPVIMSVGMLKPADIEDRLKLLNPATTTLLHCVTKYPTPLEDIQIWDMVALGKTWGTDYGLSCHCPDPAPTFSAVAHGASVVENHVLPPSRFPYSGCDASSSMSLEEYAKMVKIIRSLEKMPCPN